ncbi:hypothetical protein QEN19_002842 [Hanseniaspora menglaensis]
MLPAENNKYIAYNSGKSTKVPIWIVYTTISSLLCVFGVLLVPLVDSVKKYRTRQKIKNNHDLSDLEKNKMLVSLNKNGGSETSLRNVKLLNYGLSVSAGCMIMTSIYRILPKSDKVKGEMYISGGWIFGLLLSFTLNQIVHSYTSESLVHCPHESSADVSGNPIAKYDDINHHYNSHSHNINLLDTDNKNSHSHSHMPLKQNGLPKNTSEMLTDLCHSVSRQKSSAKLNKSASSANLSESIKCLENTIGYDLKNIDHYRSMVFNKNNLNDSLNIVEQGQDSPLIGDELAANYGSAVNSYHTSNEHSNVHPHFDDSLGNPSDHSHLLETPFSKLFSIGLQTCIALSLHKLPEGLILYFSNVDNKDIIEGKHSSFSKTGGSSIFIALAIHNFVEGFAMCLPIYSAFASKFKAVVLISLLGGMTQPLGALLGYFIHTMYMDHENNNESGFLHWISVNSELVNLLLMSVTSGFLFVIGLQMLQTAVGFSDSHDHDIPSISSDSGSNSSQSDEMGNDLHGVDHTFGTGCVKWACFGAAMILLSGIFSH